MALAKKATPFSYKRGTGFLHKASASKKLLCFLLISIASFIAGIYACIFFSVVLITCTLCAHLKVFEVLSGVQVLFFMLLLILVFRAFNFVPLSFEPEGFKSAVLFCYSAFISYYAASLFFALTTMVELRKALSKLSPAFALSISLMLGFIPRFFETWDSRKTAWKARGGKQGVKELSFLVLSVSETMIAIAGSTADALEVRGR
jgi:energy-coupling factor transporter transmembrane protein EcfT